MNGTGIASSKNLSWLLARSVLGGKHALACSAKPSPSGIDADRDTTQRVFCSRAVAVDKVDSAADRPRPRSDHGLEFCEESLGYSRHVGLRLPLGEPHRRTVAFLFNVGLG